ncbi:PAS domain S-box protein [Halorubrum sp. GN11_10-6_MGM]|nr:PAS domain S-box protein [Halorubrum sp. GN11_10-6_MGM]
MTTATTASEGASRLADGDVDCVVSGYELPASTGVELLESVRADDPDVPFILHARRGSEAVASDAVSAGVTDYLRAAPDGRRHSALADRIVDAVQSRRADARDRDERSRELERAKRLLAQTERIADVGGWELDADTEALYWTDHLFEIFEVDDDRPPTLAEALDAYLDPDREDVAAAIETARDAAEPFGLDARFERTGGEVRWLQIRGEPVVEDDVVAAVRGAVQDVTDRKEREAELERAEARFRALAEQFPNGGVHYFDRDLRYRYVAGGGFDAIETSPEDLEGRTVDEVEPYPAETAADLESVMTDTIEGARRCETLRFEGEAFEVRSAPFRGPDGDVLGGFFIAHNVTERRRRETDLERKNERLERFARVVSHDLRNPLSVAQGQLRLAMESGRTDRLEKVADALDRSQSLIDDVLALARSGAAATDEEPVAVDAVAQRCYETVDTPSAALDVETEQTVRADRNRLRRLLENLYRNAVEHNDGEVTLTVGALPDGFYVEDTGSGVPEDERESVFEVGHSSSAGGTGFGLKIVDRIADGHDWDVSLTEGSEGGARFEFTDVDVVSTE